MLDIKYNQVHNMSNPNQGKSKKVLCVCSAGLLRSPTAAWILSNDPYNFNTRAVGYEPSYALTPMQYQHVVWADEIVVMDSIGKFLVSSLIDTFNEEAPSNIERIGYKEIHILDIPDRFGFRQPELVELMNSKFEEIWKSQQ
jgi:predicted protein tyrosine phosphatase